MKKIFTTLLLVLFATAYVHADFFSDADAFLKKNVSYGKVDYAGIKAAPAELNELVSTIASYKPGSGNTGKAFWINAYNILVIKNVVDHYPIAKPLDVPGFFDQKKFKIAGQMLTLSDIENKKIRPTYKDARTHFALVCAAKSCPPLKTGAFMPSSLESQLNSVTKNAMNSKSFMRVDDAKTSAQYSQIFEWYKEDFLAEAGSIREYVNKYRSSEIPADYSESFYTYNWALNGKK